ncbi:sensor histidine kinase [Geodermatophilus marinus]|uniref:sensor histidine kinase n=1 Tax=Geodermatophilus sp. LHW52908 TaxID=2303986 RepID=UPI000E3C239B|nr:histidine kinase [Geodermatophilus sp. LHW52908]RFU20200.1 hypothetical protein D0Z06_17150 [Geodermatophilus sp. LHW52908]
MGIRARVWPGLRRRGVALEVLIALLSGLSVAAGAGTPDAVLPDALLAVGAGVLALLLLLLRRRAPLVPFAAAVLLTAGSPAVIAALPFSAYAMGRWEDRWPVRWAAAVVAAVALFQPWSPGTWQDVAGAVGNLGLAVLLPGAVGAWVRTRAELMTALTERAERAEAERELLARDAVLTERTRIAREMHDAVGHRVSLMVLQAGAIEVAAGDPARVEQLAAQVQTAGRQALEELRQMVGVLRGGEAGEAAPRGPQPGLADLPALVRDARDAGLPVELAGSATGPVDPAAGRAAYRIVQEALTNAGKHAPGAPVTVAVEQPGGELLVRVVNRAPAAVPEAPVSGGYGLVGLAERVRTLGGRFRAEPRLDGGFVVEAVLPAGPDGRS